jgi:ABC-type phosphate transport system substrate-binding protein
MRSARRVAAVGCAAVVSVLGLAGLAQAQTGARVAVAPGTTVAAGVETSVRLTLPAGCTGPVKAKGFPAPDGSTTSLQQVNSGTTAKPLVKVAGIWPPPSSDPQTFTLTITCANSKTGKETVKDESAPVPGDVVGVGSDTTENVFDQFSADYNVSHKTGGTQLYGWDATNPITGAMGDTIVTKHTAGDSTTCSVPRPDGSSAGITALENTKSLSGSPCIDFSTSSRGRSSTDPVTISFIDLAGDAVTYTTQVGTHAPPDLTAADLTGIYNCTITKWNQIPGNSSGSGAAIAAMLPQSGSGIRSFFLSAIGLTAPGGCVSTSATRQGAAGASDNTLQQNEGVALSLNTNKANVIFPFSIGKYLAEHFHSASCGTISQCFSDPSHCTPSAGLNLFGCDTHGTLQLNPIQESNATVTNPTTPFPPVKKSTINLGFDPSFLLLLYEVVNAPKGTVPASLAPLFGPTGFTCTNSTAKADLKNYGFAVLPAGSSPGDCGFAS